MIVPDVNLLIYAIDSGSPRHRPARQWLESLLSGDRPVGMAWVVILAFLRLTTRRGLFVEPLSHEEALAYIDEWLEQPLVRPIAPTDNHWAILSSLLRAAGTAGNLSTDAHLAALAIEHGATLASADNDFRRFAGLDYVNPLA